MARQRSHSIEFKRQVAQDFIAGESLYALSDDRIGTGAAGIVGTNRLDDGASLRKLDDLFCEPFRCK